MIHAGAGDQNSERLERNAEQADDEKPAGDREHFGKSLLPSHDSREGDSRDRRGEQRAGGEPQPRIETAVPRVRAHNDERENKCNPQDEARRPAGIRQRAGLGERHEDSRRSPAATRRETRTNRTTKRDIASAEERITRRAAIRRLRRRSAARRR